MSVTIRLASTGDAPQILEVYGPFVRDTHVSFEHDVPSKNDIASRIARTLQQYPWLVCEIDNCFAGYAYASAFRSRKAYQWTTETTVYVHQNFQRRGVFRALYSSLLAILREQGYRSAIGVIALPNAASIRAHEALGFRKVGIFKHAGFKTGAWRDTGWWQLELSRKPGNPPAPQSIADLAQQDGFDALLQTGLLYLKG